MESIQIGGAEFAEKKYDWKQPNRLLVLQTGESIHQAKVFKAHAVLQGFCGKLIDALKLLANQQEDGDGFIQNIVRHFGERSRKGLTQGLREFIEIDNQRAQEVRHLKAWELFKVQRLKGSQGYIYVRPHRKREMVTPWLRRCTKASKEKTGEMYEAYKELSRPVRVKKPQAQKAKSPLENEGRRENNKYYDATREDNFW